MIHYNFLLFLQQLVSPCLGGKPVPVPGGSGGSGDGDVPPPPPGLCFFEITTVLVVR